MPEYGMAAYFDHRLRLQDGLFRKTRTQASGKYHTFHRSSILSFVMLIIVQ